MVARLQLDELRRRYPVFRYESFEVERSPSKVVARFRFSAPPDLSFAPEVFFEPVSEGWNSSGTEFQPSETGSKKTSGAKERSGGAENRNRATTFDGLLSTSKLS